MVDLPAFFAVVEGGLGVVFYLLGVGGGVGEGVGWFERGLRGAALALSLNGLESPFADDVLAGGGGVPVEAPEADGEVDALSGADDLGVELDVGFAVLQGGDDVFWGDAF